MYGGGGGAALPLTSSLDNIQLETTVTTLVNAPVKSGISAGYLLVFYRMALTRVVTV